MDRTEFEALRDLKDKRIAGNITFTQKDQTRPFIIAEVSIENASGYDLRMMIRYNPEVGSKTFAVHVVGVGPICRLDVDGHNHPPAGREHKHSLHRERDPEKNLPSAVARPELKGKSVRFCFEEFCSAALISHDGHFFPPDEEGG